MPGLTGEPESWTQLGLDDHGISLSGSGFGSLPVRETCQGSFILLRLSFAYRTVRFVTVSSIPDLKLTQFPFSPDCFPLPAHAQHFGLT